MTMTPLRCFSWLGLTGMLACFTPGPETCFEHEGCQVCTTERRYRFLGRSSLGAWVEVSGEDCEGPVTLGPPTPVDAPMTLQPPFEGGHGFFFWVEIDGHRHPVRWSAEAMAQEAREGHRPGTPSVQ